VVAERFVSDGPEARYHAYLAAAYVVRYAVVRELVKGKRVLDVACGVGYGAQLLSDWGATEIVGVDLAPDAIAAAKRSFNGAGRTFLTGDAERLLSILDASEPFDVILSFDLIAHLEHPELFLQAVDKLRSPGGIVAISCPNDSSYRNTKCDGSIDVRLFTFQQFRSQTERFLGPATQWLLGARILGEANYCWGVQTAEAEHEDARSFMDQALQISPQVGLEVSAQTCSHYIGLWGAKVGGNAAISVQSAPTFLGRRRSIDWFGVRPSDREWCQREILRLMTRLSELERIKREYHEPEIARLKIQVDKYRADQADLRREVQDHRAQDLYYCEQISLLAAQIDPLRARIDELEARRRALQACISSFAWLESGKRQLQKFYTVPIIGPILRRLVGSLIRFIRRL
jgi:SAM-dependent methyltransferase